MQPQPPAIPPPRFTRRQRFFDLLPLWLGIAAWVAIPLVGNYTKYTLREDEREALWLASALIAMLFCGVWRLVRAGAIIRRIANRQYREELALTSIAAEEFLDSRLRRRLSLLAMPLLVLFPLALIACCLICIRVDPTQFEHWTVIVASVLLGLALVAFAAAGPYWAVGNILARLCRGPARAGRFFWLMTGHAVALALVPLALFPLTGWGWITLLNSQPVKDQIEQLRLEAIRHPGGGLGASMLTAAIPLVYFAGFTFFVAAMLPRRRILGSNIPRALRLFLWFLFVDSTALLLLLLVGAFSVNGIIVLAGFSPFVLGWCAFVGFFILDAPRRWRTAVDRYYKFE